MKVTNHQEGNYHYVDDSVMYGSIEMNHHEWEAVKAWLKCRYQHAIDNGETYQRDSLIHVINWSIPRATRLIEEDSPFCIGVEATRLMFEAFGLKRYKKQNYSISVINDIEHVTCMYNHDHEAEPHLCESHN